MKKMFIGIDPDVDKSGVAISVPADNSMALNNYSFFQVFDCLKRVKADYDVRVIIEAGWMNKSNWHASSRNSSAAAAQIGQRTGANHEVAKKLAEMCRYLNIPYEEVKPEKSKVDSKYFAAITGITSRTNQEQRDAAMLVIGRK